MRLIDGKKVVYWSKLSKKEKEDIYEKPKEYFVIEDIKIPKRTWENGIPEIKESEQEYYEHMLDRLTTDMSLLKQELTTIKDAIFSIDRLYCKWPDDSIKILLNHIKKEFLNKEDSLFNIFCEFKYSKKYSNYNTKGFKFHYTEHNYEKR